MSKMFYLSQMGTWFSKVLLVLCLSFLKKKLKKSSCPDGALIEHYLNGTYVHLHRSTFLSGCFHTVPCGSVQFVASGTSLQPGQRGHHWCPGAVFCLCLYCFNGVRLASASPLWFMGGMVSGSTVMVWQSKRRSLGYIHDFTKSCCRFSLHTPPPPEHLILIQLCSGFQVIEIYFLSCYYYMSIICCPTSRKQNIHHITYNTFVGFMLEMFTLYSRRQGYLGKHEPGLLHRSIPPFPVNPTGIEWEFSIPAVRCVQGSVEVLKIIIIKEVYACSEFIPWPHSPPRTSKSFSERSFS